MVKGWRIWLSDVLILLGLTALIGATMFWVKSALAKEQIENRTYLLSSVNPVLPLPTLKPTPLPTEVLLSPKAHPAKTSAVDKLDEEKICLGTLHPGKIAHSM